MQIRPIRTEADHAEALARIDRLMAAPARARDGSAAGAELDALVTLVDAFEAGQAPLSSPDPVSVIEFYLDQNHLTRRALEPLIGSRARVSEVLSRKRPLTLAMIRRLHAAFRISADLLIGEPDRPSQRTRGPAKAARLRRSTRQLISSAEQRSRPTAQRGARTPN